MLNEWRTYTAQPGQVGGAVQHLRGLRPTLEANGSRVLMLATEELGQAGTIHMLLAIEGLAARDAALAAIAGHEDPTLITHATSELLRPTPYSPEVAVASRVVEIRRYTAVPGRLADIERRFADHTIALFARHGMENCGYWTEPFGHSQRLVYLLGYESLAQRESSWAAFGKDPDWRAAWAASEANGPLVREHSARILKPVRLG
jgi:hypothetical protein